MDPYRLLVLLGIAAVAYLFSDYLEKEDKPDETLSTDNVVRGRRGASSGQRKRSRKPDGTSIDTPKPRKRTIVEEYGEEEKIVAKKPNTTSNIKETPSDTTTSS